jgi:hypothetical protein
MMPLAMTSNALPATPTTRRIVDCDGGMSYLYDGDVNQ